MQLEKGEVKAVCFPGEKVKINNCNDKTKREDIKKGKPLADLPFFNS
jgi:hypothetical protein